MIKFDVHCRLSELHAKFKNGLGVPTASVKSLKLELSSGDEISLLAIVKAVNLIKTLNALASGCGWLWRRMQKSERRRLDKTIADR